MDRRTRVMFSAMRATFIPPRKTFLIHMHITNSIRQVTKTHRRDIPGLLLSSISKK